MGVSAPARDDSAQLHFIQDRLTEHPPLRPQDLRDRGLKCLPTAQILSSYRIAGPKAAPGTPTKMLQHAACHQLQGASKRKAAAHEVSLLVLGMRSATMPTTASMTATTMRPATGHDDHEAGSHDPATLIAAKRGGGADDASARCYDEGNDEQHGIGRDLEGKLAGVRSSVAEVTKSVSNFDERVNGDPTTSRLGPKTASRIWN